MSSSAANRGSITGTVYVADLQKTAIIEFAFSTRGNQAPSAEIIGPATRLQSPVDVATDAQGDIYVPNHANAEVDEYAPSANGNAAPEAIIAGPATQLKYPLAITIDTLGNIYVRCLHLLAVFAAGSSGDAPPIAVLAGPSTHIDGSSNPAVAVDATGQIYTLHNGTGTSNAVDIFAAGANGDVKPSKKISGDFTQLNGMVDLEVDGRGTVYVLEVYSNNVQQVDEVLEFPPGAHGNVPPNRLITGPNTTMVNAFGLAVDIKGRVYVSQRGEILVFAPKATGDVAPLYTISGPKTQLKDPRGVTTH